MAYQVLEGAHCQPLATKPRHLGPTAQPGSQTAPWSLGLQPPLFMCGGFQLRGERTACPQAGSVRLL